MAGGGGGGREGAQPARGRACPRSVPTKLASALVMAAGLLAPLLAGAEPAPRAATDVGKMVTEDCALARQQGKTCVLEVPPEEIGGSAASAGDVAVQILRFGTAASLIRLRRDFIVELVMSAEDL
jgi:hypothetical protein